MKVETDPDSLRRLLLEARCSAQSIGFVPTMGYLHQGHVALFEAAKRECALVVASIFVNPSQFGPGEDFQRYPRDLERDKRIAEEASVDVLFVPTDEAMYPGGLSEQSVWIDPGEAGQKLEGHHRPGHFRGVAVVVAKLFHFTQPDRAYFGQKDAQQAGIIRRMVRDLAFPIEVRIVETVRDPDGLALSSRNAYLSETERSQAGALNRALTLGRDAYWNGERSAQTIEDTVIQYILQSAPLGKIDYVSVASMDGFEAIRGEMRGEFLLSLAVRFGGTRLIDNVVLKDKCELEGGESL